MRTQMPHKDRALSTAALCSNGFHCCGGAVDGGPEVVNSQAGGLIGCGSPRSACSRWIAREVVFVGEHRAFGAHGGQRRIYWQGGQPRRGFSEKMTALRK